LRVIKFLAKDLEDAVKNIPKFWVRGNVLVLAVILMELLRKILWINDYLQGFYNNAMIGGILFLGMIAGVDLLRSYVILSWISDLALDKSLLTFDGDDEFIVKPISAKNLVTGVLLASVSYLFWISVLVGISYLNTSLMRLGSSRRLRMAYCYVTLMLGCRRELDGTFEYVVNRIMSPSAQFP
jgi:hypothetical protein